MKFRDKLVQSFHKVFAAESVKKHGYEQIYFYTTILIQF